MKLEELQAMSDQQLNELAAIKLLWNGFVNVPSDDWKPTSDMNDAMKLLEGQEYVIMNNAEIKVQIFKPHCDGKTIFHASGNNLPRTITIVSILANGTK